MKLGRLIYGFKLGGRMMGKGTVVVILSSSDPAVQSVFPGIETSPRSSQVAVKFNHLSHPTILHFSEVEVVDD